MKISEVSTKGKLLRTRKFDTLNLFTSYRATMTKKARRMTRNKGSVFSAILDIQVAGKRRDKVFVASYNSLYYLRFCFESRRLISKSKIDNYLKGQNSRLCSFRGMSVSSNGNYVFLLGSQMEYGHKTVLYVFKLRWKRQLEEVIVYDFNGESLTSLRGIVCYGWMLKRYMILFGYTYEKDSRFLTFYFDKDEEYVFEIQHLRKKFSLNFPSKAQLILSPNAENPRKRAPVVHLVGRRGKIYAVTYS